MRFEVVHQGIAYPGEHDAIIDGDLWASVETILEESRNPPMSARSDALIVLRGAVDIGACPLVICDVDWSGDVTATDALGVLKTAVGLHVTLACPAPCTNLSFP